MIRVRGSDLGAAVVVVAAMGVRLGAAPAPAATLPKAVGAAAIAAIFPTAGTGGAFGLGATASIAATTATASTTSVTGATAAIATTGRGTASVTATAITTATAWGAAGRTGSLGFGLIDPQGASHQLGALEGLNRPAFALGIGHLHKGKTALAARIPFQGEGTVRHLSKGGKQFSDVFLFRAEGKVANKNAHRPGGPKGGDPTSQI